MTTTTNTKATETKTSAIVPAAVLDAMRAGMAQWQNRAKSDGTPTACAVSFGYDQAVRDMLTALGVPAEQQAALLAGIL